MFANLLQLITRRPPPEYDQLFIEEVRLADYLPKGREQMVRESPEKP
jgi:hypothetical protein